MSKSKHQTIKSVFGGKSRREIIAMIAENDSDLAELIAKMRIKRSVKNARRDTKQVEKLTDKN